MLRAGTNGRGPVRNKFVGTRTVVDTGPITSPNNLLINSRLAGGLGGSPGTAPTGWSLVVGTGTSAPVGSVANSRIWEQGSNGTTRPFFGQTMPALAVSDTPVLSVYIDELVSGSVQIQHMINRSGTATMNFVWVKNGVVVTSATTIATGDRIEMRATVTGAGSNAIRVGLGSGSGILGTVRFSRPQYQLAAAATAYEETT